MNKLRHYTLNTVQFLLENPLTLVMLSAVLSMTYESYRFVNIINESYNLNPQTLAMFEEFFKTPFGIHLVLGVLLAYCIFYTVVFFLMLDVVLRMIRFLLAFYQFKKDIAMDKPQTPFYHLTPSGRQTELYLFYLSHLKNLKAQKLPVQCGQCSTSITDVDYIKNYGFCDTCRKKADEQAQARRTTKKDDLLYLRKIGLL